MFFKHIPHVISTFLHKFATKTTHKIKMIGRYEEVKILQTATHADESKFVAVYVSNILSRSKQNWESKASFPAYIHGASWELKKSRELK